jgi:RND family efflux transporter MFP subunit
MRNSVRYGLGVLLITGSALVAGACNREASEGAAAAQPGAPGGARGRGGQGGGPGGGGFGGGGFRPPMAVELGKPTTGDISAELNIVGNLIGATTVDVVPRTAGRLVSVNVKLGDRVGRGQLLAKIEDQEVNEQVKQAEASHQVAQATIRQREADLKFAEVNLERSKSLFARQLLPQQSLDDAEARHSAAAAQLDLARAQFSQAQARLEELRINLGNTNITSPVNGFVGRRNVDPGAWASNQTPVVSVVDISSVRLVANVVEKDLRLVNVGDPARVEVDAFPGETFRGRIARVAPVLDPTTRTAEIEIEVPNGDFRLKPGMYARMGVTIESRTGTTLVPKSAVVDYDSKRGVFTMTADNKAKFVPLETGIEDATRVEVRGGLTTADTLITGGASSLRDNDTLVVAGQGGQGGRRGPGAGGAPKGQEPGKADGQERGRAAADGAAPKRPTARPGQ